jgi:regulatory protein
VPGGTADLTPDADPESVARSIVLRQLTMAPRSRAQLATKLAERGADDAVAARVLDRFEEVGLVDDSAFAEVLVRSQRAGRGLARRALAHELRRKGVDDETAQATLDGIDEDSERELARSLVERKLRSLRGVPHDKQVNRLVGMLARKGYPGALAMSVVREALAATAEPWPHGDDLP